MLILTGVRSQEVRLATWAEFDLEARLWMIPADHMKRSKAHMVPLSDAALVVLAKAAALKLEGSDQVFPGAAGISATAFGEERVHEGDADGR